MRGSQRDTFSVGRDQKIFPEGSRLVVDDDLHGCGVVEREFVGFGKGEDSGIFLCEFDGGDVAQVACVRARQRNFIILIQVGDDVCAALVDEKIVGAAARVSVVACAGNERVGSLGVVHGDPIVAVARVD